MMAQSPFVDIVGIYEADETEIPDRVTPTQVGHIFAGVTRAGAASERRYAEKFKYRRARQRSYRALRWEHRRTKTPAGSLRYGRFRGLFLWRMFFCTSPRCDCRPVSKFTLGL